MTVNQTATSVAIAAQPPAMADNSTYPYSAAVLDQFGNPLATQPALAWSVSGTAGGTISNTGLYSTPASSTGTDTIQVTGDGLSAMTSVNITSDGIFSGGADVGPSALPGYFSYSTGTYTVTGGDDGNNVNADYFQFPNSSFTGDATLIARVTSVNGTSTPAWAGLDFRDSTAPDTANAGIFLLPGNSIGWEVRTATGTSDLNTFGTASAPQWLKLVRSGDTFSGYYSTNGTNWTQLGSSITYADQSTILGGLFVTSGVPTALSTATFSNVSELSVAAPATATPGPVTGTSTNLSVLGSWTGGESNLTYSWSTVGTPPASVTFADNNDNTAKDTTATFTQAGVYNLLVTISDGADTVTCPLTVTVNQTATTITVNPPTASLNENGTQQFSALAYDQFGALLAPQPSFAWGIANGGIGSVDTTGLYTAPVASGTATVTASDNGVSGSATVTITNASPTVANNAAANPLPVTGTTTTLSVLGADDGGEPNLTYTWAATSEPAGADPRFSDNGDNSAKTSSVTFNEAGPYTFTCTISDGQGGTVNSSVNVTVEQTLTTIAVSPPTPTLNENAQQAFTAVGNDQFGNALTTQPTFDWALSSGIGSIIPDTGVYTSPGTSGAAAVTATSGAVAGSANITINDAAPTVATAASASPSPVTGTTTTLSVLGADDGGEPNLTYTWVATTKPAGSNPLLSTNGTNSAQNSIVTFNEAGDYTFTCTINDGQGGTVISSVDVTVDQTLSSISVSPAITDININGAQQFTAVGSDQFGNALSPQPTFAWTNSGAGSVGTTGMYTAPATGGSDTITASAGGLTGSTTLTITDGVPTVATPASASPSPVTGKTTALSVLGADDGGESDLTYAWSTINGSPSGVTFSDNSDNSAKDTTATFTQSGTYHFQVTITNPLGLFTTSSVTVDVAQTLTSVVVTPPAATLDEIATRTFTAAGFDQFGAVMSPEPTFAWTLVSGIGSIDSSSGEYTSPSQPGVATITATSGVVSGAAHITVNNAAPTVATPASASPSPVTGTSTVLSVLGADDGGESNLTYTWLATTEPSGSSPQFSINGTNAAKDTTVTFDKAGDYTFTVTIDDGQGGTVASTVNVTVAQTLTAISVGPSNTDINENSSQQFAATGYDQFGNVLTTPPIFQWTNTGAGSVDSSGLYTAPAAAGFDTVFASNDGVRGSAHLTITDGVPTVVTPASVPSPTVAGTAAALSVLGDDDGGESDLTYTWTTTGTPPANVTFSENGDNAAKDATATFTKAGTYDFLVTIENPIGLFTTSSVTVTVNQTLTRIVVTPPTTTIDENATQPFTAVGYDQFGLPMATQPTFAWGLSSGVGSVATDTGVYTSPGISGVATVVASSAAVSGSANITVANAEPTVAIPASAAPSPVTGTTTNLSVLGADDGGESNLRYTWVTTARPTNGYPLFSVNGTNSAKDSTVTFDKAGDYTFACTISDGQGGSVFTSVSVTVLQTLSQLKVTASPGTSVSTDGTVNLTALELDQFARPMAEEAPIAWSVSSGSGTVSSDGVFVASSQAGAVVVEAAVGSLSGTITLTVGATTPLTVVPSRNPPPPPGPGSDGGDSTTDLTTGGSIADKPVPAEPASDLSSAASKDLSAWLQEKSATVAVVPSASTDDSAVSKPLKPAPDLPVPAAKAVSVATTAPSDLKPSAASPRQLGTVEIAPINRTEIVRELDRGQSDAWDQGAADDARLKLRVGLASAIGSTAASAYLLWLVRGGGVLASLLSSAPAWKLVDPLFVLPSRPFYRAMWHRRKRKETENPEDRFFGKNRRE